jgi:hypothetical protein
MSVKPGYLDFGLVASVRKFVISKETTAGDIDWGVSPSQAWISIYPAAGAGASNPGDTLSGFCSCDNMRVEIWQFSQLVIRINYEQKGYNPDNSGHGYHYYNSRGLGWAEI